MYIYQNESKIKQLEIALPVLCRRSIQWQKSQTGLKYTRRLHKSIGPIFLLQESYTSRYPYQLYPLCSLMHIEWSIILGSEKKAMLHMNAIMIYHYLKHISDPLLSTGGDSSCGRLWPQTVNSVERIWRYSPLCWLNAWCKFHAILLLLFLTFFALL